MIEWFHTFRNFQLSQTQKNSSFQRPASPGNFSGAEKLIYVYRVCIIQDQSFNNSENDTMKLSLDEANLTDLLTRNCATIQQVLILKFAFGPEKFPGLSKRKHEHILPILRSLHWLPGPERIDFLHGNHLMVHHRLIRKNC